MSIVSEIWTWQEGERIYSRLTTNVCAKRLLARLTALGILESVETIHAYLGDRADGERETGEMRQGSIFVKGRVVLAQSAHEEVRSIPHLRFGLNSLPCFSGERQNPAFNSAFIPEIGLVKCPL